MSNSRRCFFVGITVRILSESAAKSGIGVYAIDCFNDLDTDAIAIRSELVDIGNFDLDSDSVLKAIEKCDPERELPVIYASGVEQAPSLLDDIAQHRRLLGNSTAVVRNVKDPKVFFDRLRALGVPHPETRLAEPPRDERWLVKQVGSSGGVNTEFFKSTSADTEKSKAESTAESGEEKTFIQRYIDGDAISATVIGDGQNGAVVGYSRQWCSRDVPSEPFLYGGAVSLDSDHLSESFKLSVAESINAVTSSFNLRGLMSFDMIVDGDDWYLLEVNPRPSATFELHEGSDSFIVAHWDVFENQRCKVTSVTRDGVFRSHCIVYTKKDIQVPTDWEWPDWVSDRGRPNDKFEKGDPFCTVNAEAASSDLALEKVQERHRMIHETIENWAAQGES